MVPIARDTVIEDLSDGVIVVGANNRVVDLNPAAVDIIGSSAGEVVGKPASEALARWSQLVECVERGTEINGELTLGEGSGRQVYELRISALHDRRRFSGRLVVLHNITRRKQAEEEMVRSQRLRAVGELSLGISHNLNNILTGVLGPAELIKGMTTDARIRPLTELIIDATLRASSLVQRLGKTFQSSNAEKFEPVAVAEVVREAVLATRPRWKDETEARGLVIEIDVQIADVPAVAATRAGLHDVLLNLIFNAVDALPQGGQISIVASQSDDEVVLAVSDNGIGMDAHVRSRVFEPFFTTKMDVGTGLGLSTAYAAVTQWGGHIDVTSRPGEGATFAVGLPVWSATRPRQAGTDESVPVPPDERRQRRQARVLVVDDEEMVRGVVKGLMDRCGYQGCLASSGEEAQELFHPGDYEVALIDLGMPGMSGDALALDLRGRDPRLVTVLVTGWNLSDQDPRLADFDLTIAKPFRLAAIAEVMGRALDLHDARQRA